MEWSGKGTMNREPVKLRRRANPASMPAWVQQIETWRSLLVECGSKQTRKRVHLLRVSTLRIQAQVELWLECNGSDHPAAWVARRWNKHAKQLRKSLGAVRAFDVHLVQTGELRGLLTAPSGYEPRSSRLSLRQVDDLERYCKRERKRAAGELVAALATRHHRIEGATQDLAGNLNPQPLLSLLTPEHLETRFRQMVLALPTIDVDSLHELRKQLKSVRYLAELIQFEPRAREFAATVKSMQGAIGRWHDLEELSEEAAHALRKRPIEGGLSEVLQTMTNESLESAIATCQSIIGEFALSPEDAISILPMKKSAGRATASGADQHALSA
jgi:CHAD domain-containing protein